VQIGDWWQYGSVKSKFSRSVDERVRHSASQQEPLAYRFGGEERNASEARIPPVYHPTIVDLGSGRVDDEPSKYSFFW
jgi:hypothetical protein